jgi:hypothetical protein
VNEFGSNVERHRRELLVRPLLPYARLLFVIEGDAPDQVVSGFELKGIRVHRAKTLNMK